MIQVYPNDDDKLRSRDELDLRMHFALTRCPLWLHTVCFTQPDGGRYAWVLKVNLLTKLLTQQETQHQSKSNKALIETTREICCLVQTKMGNAANLSIFTEVPWEKTSIRTRCAVVSHKIQMKTWVHSLTLSDFFLDQQLYPEDWHILTGFMELTCAERTDSHSAYMLTIFLTAYMHRQGP